MRQMKRITVILGTILVFTFGSAVAAFAEESSSAPASAQSTDSLPNKAGTFPANVSVNGISLEGMTLDEANTAISIEADRLLERTAHLTYSDQALDQTLTSLGITWANPNVVNELDSYVSRGNFIVRYKAMKALEFGPVEKSIELTGSTEQIKSVISPALQSASASAQNATITRANGQFVITPEQTGVSYDADAAASSILSQALDISAESISYNAEAIITEPTIKAELFSNFSNTPLGSSTTAFLTSDTNRSDNIHRSSEGVNGNLFMPGEEISALKMFGDVTEENGYKPAGTYLDGAVIDDIGGGICQTSSTLYNAVLWSELKVTKRNPHSMAVDYLPPSMDAMVSYKAGYDFTFVNNTDYPIYIESYCSDSGVNGYANLTINIYGTETRPANRTIEYRPEVLLWEYPGTLFDFVEDSSMKLGFADYSQKEATVVNVHPHIKSKLYKDVKIDGQVTETIEINHLDEYRFSTGTIRHSPDVNVEVNVDDTGRAVEVKLEFLDGTPVTNVAPGWSQEQMNAFNARMRSLCAAKGVTWPY